MLLKCRLPANLNLDALNVTLTGVPGLARTTRGVVLLYNYLLSHDTKPQEAVFADDYTQVGRSVLQSFLDKEEYLETLCQLLDNDYLERLDHDEDGQYYPEGYYAVADASANTPGRCKSFRVPAALLEGADRYQVLEMVLTKTELNKIENVRKHRVQYAEPYRDVIRENMNNIILVDTPASRRVLTKLYAANSVRVHAELYLDMWNHNLFHDTTVDSFGRRVHGPLTSAPRELRPFMRFRSDDQAPLVELDFVASQPSLLASITPKFIRKYAPECAAAIPFFQAIEGHENWELYKATCLDDREGHSIYNFLARAFEQRFKVAMTRDDGKNIYYRACFSRYHALDRLSIEDAETALDWHLANSEEKARNKAASNLFTLRSYDVFKAEFPRVHRLFRDLKGIKWNIEGQGAPHANNCLLAQRIESGLMYTTLVKALLEAGITQVVTIHDALFIRQQDEAKARKLIQKELDRLKLNLKLKSK